MPYYTEDNPVRINWTKDVGRIHQVLDYLEENDEERTVLFSAYNHSGRSKNHAPSKLECAMRMALAILIDDDDHNLREGVKRNTPYYGQIFCHYLRYGLKKRYQRFNEKIGPTAARTSYQDIMKDVKLHKKILKLMEQYFPEWSRFHSYWRTMWYFNQYWSECNSSTKANDVRATRRSKNQGDHAPAITFNHSSEDESSDNDNDPQTHILGENESAEPPTREVHSEVVQNTPANEVGQDVVHHSFTAASWQENELRMAEILLRRQELELQEKKIAADIETARLEAETQRERDKNEIVLHLLSVLTSRGNP